MKSSKVAMVGLGLLVMAGLALGQDAAKVAAPSELKDMKAKASYAIGLGLGRNLKSAGADIDADLLARGVKDAVAGGKVLLTDDQVKDVMVAFQEQLKSKQMEIAKSAVEKNKKEGEAFLAANKAKPGVVTLPSGLQYKVIKEGTGKTPKATDTVSTHYRGTLLDGTEFDSSIKRGQPRELSRQRRDPRLDRSPSEDEGRLEVATLHPLRARLRRIAAPGLADRPERGPRLRHRAAQRRMRSFCREGWQRRV